MSGQQLGTIVGGVIGFAVGGPVGAQIGMVAGGTIGGIVDPMKIKGPHIGAGQAQSATDGTPISWVMGTMWTAGTIVDVGERREVKKTSGGKGGKPKTTTYEAHQDFVILVCESDEIKGSTISNVLAIEQDGKIVYDVRPGSTIVDDSQKYIQNISFYYGDEAQLPPALVETIHGAGQNPAYRGVLLACFSDFNLTPAGDRIPSFRFLVTSVAVDPVGFGGGQAYPSTSTVATESAAGGYTFEFAMGTVPDKAQVFAGDQLLLDTGYWGDPAQQSILNAALAAHSAPPETIHDSGARPPLNANDEFANPATRQMMPFQKPAGVTTLTVKMWSPIAGTLWNYAILAPGAGVQLDAITGALVTRGGLTTQQFDASDFAATRVAGYSIAQQMSANDALGPLLGSYFAYGCEYDGKINFLFSGADAVLTIDEDDIVDTGNEPVSEATRGNATEYPRRVIGAYYDPDQNYLTATVMATRRASGVKATGDLSFQIPVVMSANEAQQAVDKAMKAAYARLDGTQNVTLPFATASNCYLRLVSGDAVIYQGRRWVVAEETIGAGTITLSLQADRQSAYTSDVQAIPGRVPTAPQSLYSGPTKIIPMSLPKLQSQDPFGIYVVTYSDPHNPSWRSAAIQMSLDSGATWQDVGTSNVDGNIGALTAADGSITITAQFTGDLSSVGTPQLDAGQNAAVLIHGTSTEVLQFGTATEDGTTDNLYVLTDLRRDQAGTGQVTGAIGDKIVLLDAAQVIPIDTGFAGTTIQFRAVGGGENSDDAVVVSVVYNPDVTTIISGGTFGDDL